MNFLEKDLEQVIYEAPDSFIKANFGVKGKRYRQQKIGMYGRSDLILIDRKHSMTFDYDNKKIDIYECGLEITIFELKRDQLNADTMLQAIRYAKGIKMFLEERDFYNYYFKIILCGRSIDSYSNFIYMADLFNNQEEGCIIDFNTQIKSIDIYTYNYEFDGLKIKPEYGYHVTNNKF